MPKACLTLILLLCAFQPKAQVDELNLLSHQMDSLFSHHLGRSGFLDSWDDFDQDEYDSLYASLEERMKQLDTEELFQLKNGYIKVLESPDHNLKVVEFEYINGGTLEETFSWVIWRNAKDSLERLPLDFWVEEVFPLGEKPLAFLLKGGTQGCSTCFEESALLVYPRKAIEEWAWFGSGPYRHYIGGTVIRWDAEALQLQFNYEEVSIEDSPLAEKAEKPECWKWTGTDFQEVKCTPAK